jgi:MFS family permease
MFRQLFAVAALLGLALAALSWRNRDNTPGPLTEGVNLGTGPESAQTTLPESSVKSTQRTGITYRAAQWLFIVYFATLGVGFMLVEIPLTQKLILPLGYPTLALTVILFALLLGGGAGAWFSQRFHRKALRRWTIVSALAVACVSMGLAHSAEFVSQMLLGLHLAARCALVGAALLPCGFFLGAPFPSGMRLFAHKFERNVPLVWGLNGVASVVGSLGAAMGAKLWGFHTVLLSGAAVYVAAAALLAAASDLGAGEGE